MLRVICATIILKSIIAVSVAVSVIVFVSGLPSARGEERLRIGVISGLTGAAAKWSALQNMGIELAAEEARSSGVAVDLIFEDSQTQGARAVAAYNKLVNLSKVDALISDDFGVATAPLLPLAKKQKKMIVSTGLSHQQYCESGGDFFVSVGSQIERTKPAFENFFRIHPEIKRIGLIIFDDPEWGHVYRGVWEDIAKSQGITVVDTVLNNQWTPDFKSMMVKMAAKKPDALLVAHEPEGFIKAARQLHFEGQIVIANCVLEMLTGSETPRVELDGVYTVDPIVSPEFRAAFQKRFNREPILEAYAGYEAVRTLVRAAAANKRELQRGIRAVSYAGVAGRVDFSGQTCLGNLASWGLYRFEGGKLVGRNGYNPK
jgi:ABC-type branched-subunit amino acid transport system substrate-binding protein